MVKDYFVKVFVGPDSDLLADNSVSPRIISSEQNRMLTVNQMHPEKASGPDGLNPAFYQIFGN